MALKEKMNDHINKDIRLPMNKTVEFRKLTVISQHSRVGKKDLPSKTFKLVRYIVTASIQGI